MKLHTIYSLIRLGVLKSLGLSSSTLIKIVSAFCGLILFSSVISSCSKSFLTKVPEDQLSDAIFWKTEKDADVALAGIYSGWENYRQIGWLDMMSDMFYSKFPTPLQVMGNGQMNPMTPGLSFFN